MGLGHILKKAIHAPVTALSNPKASIKDVLSGPKLLAHGDVDGALKAAFIPGANLEDKRAQDARAYARSQYVAPLTPQEQGQARIDQSRQRGMMGMPGLGMYSQIPQAPINYQPQPFQGLGQQPGQMPMIRQQTLGAVLGPFGQPNWGQPVFGQDPRNQLMSPILNRAWK